MIFLKLERWERCFSGGK